MLPGATMRAHQLLLIFTLAAAGAVQAQTPADLAAGDQMRVWSSVYPNRMLEGRLHTWTADSVTLRSVAWPRDLKNQQLALATPGLVRVDVERLRSRSEGAKHGIGKGLLSGLICAGIAYYLLDGIGAEDVGPLTATTFFTGVAVGVGMGYMSPGKTWQQVHPPATRP